MAARGVYAILDGDAWRARGVELAHSGVAEAIADALVLGGASTLQLRAKSEPARVALELLRRLQPRTRARGVRLVANDRVDLALLAGADAVHVGQDDLPLSDVRGLARGIDVGVSTHDLAQLREALDARPSYVAFGPVFATTSKRQPDTVVGLDLLREASALATRAGIPLVAIGGVTLERAPSIVERGVRWAAVIGDLVAVDESASPDVEAIERRTRALVRAFEVDA